MNIQIHGLGEKRAVVYPLLYLLNQLDGAQLITDDTAYRRLVPSGVSSIGNIAVSICAGGIGEAFPAGERTGEYAVTVFDCGGHAVEMGEGDETIWVKRAKENGDAPVHAYRVACVDFERPSGQSKAPFVSLSLPLLRRYHRMEAIGRLEAVPDKASVRALAPMFAEIFNLSEKTVKFMLTKGGAQT